MPSGEAGPLRRPGVRFRTILWVGEAHRRSTHVLLRLSTFDSLYAFPSELFLTDVSFVDQIRFMSRCAE